MVQEYKETRRCVICSGNNNLMDMYKFRRIINKGNNQKTDIPKPTTLCNECFMKYKWNKKGKS